MAPLPHSHTPHPHHGAHHHAPPKKPIHYHNITIDGTGTKSYKTPVYYEHAVVALLQRIHNSHTGQAVFHEFEKRTHKVMKVIPLENVVNAFAGADDILHATAKGQILRSGADGSVLTDAAQNTWAGKGGGSDSTVSFNPLTWTKFCAQKKRGHKCGAHPDEILFHEMIHATRQMRGILDPKPLGFLYDTEEEFFAIVIANIYASETGRQIDIRSDHAGFEHLTTDTNVKFLPKKDYTDYRYRLVHQLVRTEPRMAMELAKLKHVPFNPIRRYFELQRSHHPVHGH